MRQTLRYTENAGLRNPKSDFHLERSTESFEKAGGKLKSDQLSDEWKGSGTELSNHPNPSKNFDGVKAIEAELRLFTTKILLTKNLMMEQIPVELDEI